MNNIAWPNKVGDCQICKSDNWQTMRIYTEKPDLETDYGFQSYRRGLFQCNNCGHFENRYGPDINLSNLYTGNYWDSTYKSKIKDTFSRIMNLPAEHSDNRGRVKYINDIWAIRFSHLDKKALDIGSGLAVFPAVMKETGWDITALDPDPNAAQHARDNAAVSAIAADYLKEPVEGKYNLISLNKVLEHVPDMGVFLKKVKTNLTEGGVAYLEIPDGEKAIEDSQGPDREEFLVEHYCAFSARSFLMLAENSGFELITMERLIEPSGKYTLRGFFKPIIS